MRNSIIISILIFLIITSTAGAQGLTGNDVLQKVEENRNEKSHYIEMVMELYNEAGDMRSRSVNNYFLEDNNLDKTLIEFTSPADIEGTKFLSLDEKNTTEEDMYLYLPVLTSVRKISGSQKNGNFVGSDFTYNDLNIFSGANYRDNFNGEILEEDSEEVHLKLEIKDPEIDYSFGYMWVLKEYWLPKKIEFYDQNEELEKVINLSEYEKIDDNWTARHIQVENVQKGSQTVLKMEEVNFNPDLDPNIFTVRYLQR